MVPAKAAAAAVLAKRMLIFDLLLFIPHDCGAKPELRRGAAAILSGRWKDHGPECFQIWRCGRPGCRDSLEPAMNCGPRSDPGGGVNASEATICSFDRFVLDRA